MSAQRTVALSARDQQVEQLLRGQGDEADPLTAVLDELRPPRRAPQPSPELAAVLAGAAPPADVGVAGGHRARRRLARATVGLGLAGVAFTGVGVAAAHDALPGPVQRAVTTAVDRWTPFHLGPRGGAEPVTRTPGDGQQLGVPKHPVVPVPQAPATPARPAATQTTEKRAKVEAPKANPANANQPTAERSTAERSTAERSTVKQPPAKQPAANANAKQSPANQPKANQSSAKQRG